eukprot:Filipodium_phascolosomae@DN2519_c1_g1_i2.p1
MVLQVVDPFTYPPTSISQSAEEIPELCAAVVRVEWFADERFTMAVSASLTIRRRRCHRLCSLLSCLSSLCDKFILQAQNFVDRFSRIDRKSMRGMMKLIR